MLQNDVSRDHFSNMALKMTILTTLYENISELPVERFVVHKINIVEINSKNSPIWGLTWIAYMSFLSFILWKYEMKKCSWPYHVTYQPISNKEWFDLSVAPRWVIRRWKERISTITFRIRLREAILTFCQFPDLPIEFRENECMWPLPFRIGIPE